MIYTCYVVFEGGVILAYTTPSIERASGWCRTHSGAVMEVAYFESVG